MSKLSPEQFAQVEQWASEGANLNLIQDRLKADFNITLTYMEARLLMLDIGVKIKDKPKPVEKPAEPAVSPKAEAAVTGALKVTSDEVAVPGALISGKVTFSDGQTAGWYIDQAGRPGIFDAPPEYQPPQADVAPFQKELERALQQGGF